mmetsp:Transcript_25211/g.75687  ORF Transcript_25211/g.75687 Transcript_25211/m.75687 type:complete len:282 (+) Transcript_25211:221-1066(+)
MLRRSGRGAPSGRRRLGLVRLGFFFVGRRAERAQRRDQLDVQPLLRLLGPRRVDDVPEPARRLRGHVRRRRHAHDRALRGPAARHPRHGPGPPAAHGRGARANPRASQGRPGLRGHGLPPRRAGGPNDVRAPQRGHARRDGGQGGPVRLLRALGPERQLLAPRRGQPARTRGRRDVLRRRVAAGGHVRQARHRDGRLARGLPDAVRAGQADLFSRHERLPREAHAVRAGRDGVPRCRLRGLRGAGGARGARGALARPRLARGGAFARPRRRPLTLARRPLA